MPLTKEKKVTIYTLSKDIGVSPATVSKALNNHPSISANVRAKIRKKADGLGFKPRLVSTRATNICVVIQHFSEHPIGFSDYISLTMEGIAEYCQEEHLEMSIYGGTPEEMNSKDIVRDLYRRMVSGAVVLSATEDCAYIEQMKKQRFPFFCLDHEVSGLPEQSLVFDNREIGYLATKYLISLGHRDIGIVLDSIHRKSPKARHQGYLDALEEAGIEPQDRLFFSLDPITSSYKNSYEIGAEGIGRIIEQAPQMTALFAVDDLIAIGAMTRLQMNNISIPGDISVVGVSDYPHAKHAFPPLTTIFNPYAEIGYEAARQVHRLCRGKDVVIRQKVLNDISPKLVLRNSTGPRREGDRKLQALKS